MNDTNGFDFWALVELFGHQRIAGHITEQQIGGDAFVRIDVPDSSGATRFTRFFGPKAVYAINPVTKEVAIQIANAVDAAPVKEWDIKQLPAHAEQRADEPNCDGCGMSLERCMCREDEDEDE